MSSRQSKATRGLLNNKRDISHAVDMTKTAVFIFASTSISNAVCHPEPCVRDLLSNKRDISHAVDMTKTAVF